MRATRDLLRRRTHLMRKRAALLAHVQNTNSQYNSPHWLYKKIKNLISGQLSGSEVNTPFQTVT
jgi:hypothetical protein